MRHRSLRGNADPFNRRRLPAAARDALDRVPSVELLCGFHCFPLRRLVRDATCAGGRRSPSFAGIAPATQPTDGWADGRWCRGLAFRCFLRRIFWYGRETIVAASDAAHDLRGRSSHSPGRRRRPGALGRWWRDGNCAVDRRYTSSWRARRRRALALWPRLLLWRHRQLPSDRRRDLVAAYLRRRLARASLHDPSKSLNQRRCIRKFFVIKTFGRCVHSLYCVPRQVSRFFMLLDTVPQKRCVLEAD